MTARSIIICILVVVLTAPSLTARQRQEPPEVWQAFAEKLESGAYIRVKLKDGKQVKGYFIPSSGDSLRVRPKTRIQVPIRDFKFVDIESIDRQHDGWSPGAKVATGVAIGVGAVLALAAAIAAAWD